MWSRNQKSTNIQEEVLIYFKSTVFLNIIREAALIQKCCITSRCSHCKASQVKVIVRKYDSLISVSFYNFVFVNWYHGSNSDFCNFKEGSILINSFWILTKAILLIFGDAIILMSRSSMLLSEKLYLSCFLPGFGLFKERTILYSLSWLNDSSFL